MSSQSSLVIQRSATPHGYAGNLHIQSNEEASQQRQVQGPNCSELANALTVVAAIARETHQEAIARGPQAEKNAVPQRKQNSSRDSPEPPYAHRGHSPTNWNFIPQAMKIQTGTLYIGVANPITARGSASFGLIPSVTLPLAGLSFRSAWFNG